jgi:hypothetical protein
LRDRHIILVHVGEVEANRLFISRSASAPVAPVATHPGKSGT